MSAKGLTVVAVTKQDRSAVDKFVEETGAKHPIVIESSDSMRNYGTHSFPSAYLIGPNGRILWNGHPGNLADSVIAERLAEAKILPAFPSALSAARKSLEKDKFADARKKVLKALESGALNADDLATAGAIRDWIDWYATSTLEGAARDAEAGNAYEAWLAYDEIAHAYKGLETGEQAAAQAKELAADSDRKREIDAGRKLDKARLQIRDLSPKKAVKVLTALTGKRYGETRAGKRAAELIAALEQEK